jgi:Spy/CpxP family protein refolding chaperone
MKLTSRILLTALTLTASAVLANAQENQAQGQGRQRGGDRGNFNPEEFRQRMNDRLKTSLKVTDEEWAIIQPLIEKVQTAQRDAMGSRFGGGGRGPGGGGGEGGSTSDRPGAAASQALRTALESDSTSPDELKAKLAAVREVRKKSAAELAAARASLEKVVTVRQEAVLVSMGILE